jgi:hypothetical protein
MVPSKYEFTEPPPIHSQRLRYGLKTLNISVQDRKEEVKVIGPYPQEETGGFSVLPLSQIQPHLLRMP